jgi:hypothetical protein
MLCGLCVALSMICTAPVRVPLAVGVNVIEIWQLPPAATEEPHVFDSAKSPLDEMEAIASAIAPVFENVTACDALVMPTACELNATDPGFSVALVELPP